MTGRRPLAAAALAAAVAVPAVAAAVDSAPRITKDGAGAVKLGASYDELRSAGLLGRKVPGCELAGPGQRSARLRSPLKGSVDLTTTEPRKVRTIVIRGGDAHARGVRVGNRARKIKRAFPGATVDASTDELFGLTLYRVKKRFVFAVDTDAGRVELIGIPYVPFCE